MKTAAIRTIFAILCSCSLRLGSVESKFDTSRIDSVLGRSGTLAVDASISIAACLLMRFLLSKLDRKQSKPAVERVSLASELLQ
jgi:hypothetical protein